MPKAMSSSRISNQRIRFVNIQPNAVTATGIPVPSGNIQTVAGNGTQGSTGDTGAATSAEIRSPEQTAVDGAGNIYIATPLSNVVRKVHASPESSRPLLETESRCVIAGLLMPPIRRNRKAYASVPAAIFSPA